MCPGKKGFDRLIYASKNALAEPMTWLFCNTASKSMEVRSTLHFLTNTGCSS
jgi:ribonuclease P/MRP protein subunit RPP40